MSSVRDVVRLWSGTSPARAVHETPQGGMVACPLRGGLVSVTECGRCRWASAVSVDGPAPSVRCNPSIQAVLVGAVER